MIRTWSFIATLFMTDFEHMLYAEPLSPNEYNKRWWELKAKHQGIAPPAKRGEEYCDAASKTHINNDAAQYYDYAISTVLLFQFHDHIATRILKQDPRATNYYGSKKVGKFLYDILSPGSNCDWRELTREVLGEDMSAEAMLRYFTKDVAGATLPPLSRSFVEFRLDLKYASTEPDTLNGILSSS